DFGSVDLMTNPLDVFRDGVIAGHVAVITGGGTGICKGIAAAYARLGCDVCITSRKQDVLDATAAELRAATKRDVLAIAADVRDPDALVKVVDAMTKNLSVEWAGAGVRVVSIAPGPIAETEGMKRLAPGEAQKQAKKAVPLGRFGTIDEIAAAAVYLRSAAAAYITGVVLVV